MHCSCAVVFITKKPVGQYESRSVSWVDCLPSESIMVTVQLVKGGPLLPSSNGPQTSDTVEFVLIDRLAARMNSFALDEDAGVKRQLLLRKKRIVESEKKVRGQASDGNVPVMVSDASPAYDKLLGSTRKETGEKSRTVTAMGRVMLKTGALSIP